MNVTTNGVKGYEYQYKVTVLIALLTKSAKYKLYVEKDESEDILLKIDSKGKIFTFEIQVKREHNLINTTKLVKWLCHFKPRKFDKNLLQKLIDNTQNIAIFITHSRCSDSTFILKKDFSSFEKHKSISISQKVEMEFKNALKNIKFGKTDLMKNREKFCIAQSKNFNSKLELERVLEQCLIIEEFTDEKVDNSIKSLLNSEYSIAQSRTELVYLQLLEIVKSGRDNGLDISNKLNNQIVSEKIGTPIIDSHYKTRKEESNLINDLSKNGILLLTGTSLCGKTELAKNIAIHFIKKGFVFEIHDDISNLKRFFNSNISDNKIAILEDPFGHYQINENYLDISNKLKNIICNKEKHHYLIVSSRIELLSTIFESPNISDFKIKNFNWHELTIKDVNTINSFWKVLAKNKSLPNQIIKIVSNGILKSKSENLLQIGQLMYLANMEIEQLNDKNENDLEHIARRNLVEIANDLKIKNEFAADILSIISICSNPIHKLEFKDLAYILSESKSLTSIKKNDFFKSLFNDEKSQLFPEYPINLVLEKDVLNAINFLEEKGFLIIYSESLIITHPNYYEAGRYLFFEKGSIKQKTKLDQLKKIITCLSPITSYLAATNYHFIYKKINAGHKNEVISIAFIGLNSIFPSVEDISLIFLINFIQELEEEQKQKLISKIQSGGTSSFNIFWHNDIPFISNESNFSNLIIQYDELRIIRAKDLISQGILPNIHDAWIYIGDLNKNSTISKSEVSLLLQFNFGFFRQKLVYQIFTHHSNILDKKILVELFNDEHPSVVFSVIRASLINWFSLDKTQKKLIIKLSLNSFSKRPIAIRAFNLFSTFSIDYGHESIFINNFNEPQKKEMWQLWGKLYPKCVENIPLGVNINSTRFGDCMNESIKYLNINSGLKVLEAWYKRIDYQIKGNSTLDEYELSIADHLMQLTLTNSSARKKIFLNLIEYNDTNFILSNLKWIIEYWDKLDYQEKNKVISIIHSDRLDTRWIKAVMLNSHNPPKEIILEILGEFDLFEKDVKEIYSAFPKNLLRDCLNVFCGFPQPLWSLAVHHKNTNFWEELIKHILMDDNNVGFDICLHEFVRNGVNGFTSYQGENMIFWGEICSKTKNRDTLTNSLIYNMINCSCSLSSTKKMWSILIHSYRTDSEFEKLINCIRDNLDVILYFEVSDLLRVIDDINIIDIINTSSKLKNHKDINIENKSKKRKDEMDLICNYKLDNWIGIN